MSTSPSPTPDGEVMIHVDQLTRVYGSAAAARPAVSNISFSVSRGEVLGFLGPNGAGKTTTMKMLTCYLPPTAGAPRSPAHDVYDEPLEVRRGSATCPRTRRCTAT